MRRIDAVKARLVSWQKIRPGDLIQTRDDLIPLRVLSVHRGYVVVYEGLLFWDVYFRSGARVLRFTE
jgi:hypothetical protein